MTTTSATVSHTLQRPAPLGAATRYQVRFLGAFFGWFWLVVAVGAAVAAVVTAPGSHDGGQSIWEQVAIAPRWFLFSMTGLLVATVFPTWVAHGMTRRTFGIGAGVATLASATAYAAVLTLGFVLERAVFEALGRGTTLAGPHLYADTGQVGPVLLEYTLVLAAYGAAGLLTYAAYYRLGGIRGTVALPVPFLLLLVSEALLGSGWEGQTAVALLRVDVVGLPVAARVAGSLLAIVASVVAAHVLLRRAAIRPPA